MCNIFRHSLIVRIFALLFMIALMVDSAYAIKSSRNRGRAARSHSSHKITICHIPPGNPGNAHTISIDSHAWSAHQKHGDYRGSCRQETPTPTPDATPTPQEHAACSAGGPYLNIPCSSEPASVQLTGVVDTDAESPTSLAWTTDCPDGSFDDNGALAPLLSFATSTGDDLPVSCVVRLTLTYADQQQVSCEAPVTVTQCARDCLGVVNGQAQYDQCGVCNGDGSSCACADVNIQGQITELTTKFGLQCGNLERKLRRYGKNSCLRNRREFAQLRKAMARTCRSGTAQIRSIPLTTGNCLKVCTLCDNELTKHNLSSLSAKLYKLTRRAVDMHSSCLAQGVCSRSMAECRQTGLSVRREHLATEAEVRSIHKNALDSLSRIPSSTYDCSK